MKLKITTYLLILFTISVFAQQSERVVIKGKVIVENNEVEGVTVYNKSTKKGTSTDPEGKFEITAGLNDVLIFGALQFKDFEASVTEQVLETRKMIVYLIEEVNKLDEVLILPYDLTGFLDKDIEDVKTFNPDMDAIYFGIKHSDEYEFSDDYKSSVENIAMHSQAQPMIVNGLNVKNILGLLLGDKKNKKKKQERAKLRTPDIPVNKLRVYYNDDFITTNFKIPKENIDDFVVYLEENGLDYSLLKKGKEMQFLEFINLKSQLYLLTQRGKN